MHIFTVRQPASVIRLLLFRLPRNTSHFFFFFFHGRVSFPSLHPSHPSLNLYRLTCEFCFYREKLETGNCFADDKYDEHRAIR